MASAPHRADRGTPSTATVTNAAPGQLATRVCTSRPARPAPRLLGCSESECVHEVGCNANPP
jgi:hypothetical protein